MQITVDQSQMHALVLKLRSHMMEHDEPEVACCVGMAGLDVLDVLLRPDASEVPHGEASGGKLPDLVLDRQAFLGGEIEVMLPREPNLSGASEAAADSRLQDPEPQVAAAHPADAETRSDPAPRQDAAPAAVESLAQINALPGPTFAAPASLYDGAKRCGLPNSRLTAADAQVPHLLASQAQARPEPEQDKPAERPAQRYAAERVEAETRFTAGSGPRAVADALRVPFDVVSGWHAAWKLGQGEA